MFRYRYMAVAENTIPFWGGAMGLGGAAGMFRPSSGGFRGRRGCSGLSIRVYKFFLSDIHEPVLRRSARIPRILS